MHTEMKNRFHILNGNPSTKKEADGMIAVFIEKGAYEDMCRVVLGIGNS
jgi:hypothetical protein